MENDHCCGNKCFHRLKAVELYQHWQRKSQRHIHVCIKLCHNLQCLNQVSSCKESKQSPLDPSCGLNCDHTSGCISDIGNAERCWHSARKAFFQQYFRRSSSYSSIICITYIKSQTTEQKLYIFYIARLFYIFYTSRPGLLRGKTFNTIKKTCFLWKEILNWTYFSFDLPSTKCPKPTTLLILFLSELNSSPSYDEFPSFLNFHLVMDLYIPEPNIDGAW